MKYSEGDILICKKIHAKFNVGKKYTIRFVSNRSKFDYRNIYYYLNSNGDERRLNINIVSHYTVERYFSTLQEHRNSIIDTLLS